MPHFPPETVAVTVDGHSFVGRLERDLTTWGVYVFEPGFRLYLTPDEASDAAYLSAQMRAMKGQKWDVERRPVVDNAADDGPR